ncbi:MAG: hypothetical protein HWE13_14240 [Gammaproteobacteria bacterium]|nr:hypothetical protein [Gammaproteobacteria bacterium]
MNNSDFPLLLALELALLLSVVLGGALWLSLRELKRQRQHLMKTRREHARLKRKLVENSQSTETPTDNDYFAKRLTLLAEHFNEHFPEHDLESFDSSTPESLLYQLRYQSLLHDQSAYSAAEPVPDDDWIRQLSEQLPNFSATPNNEVSVHAHQAERTQHEDDHYRNLYDDLLITLQKSKETIRALALRLSEIIDEGMDEDKLNALLSELNNSMEAFGELSGIATSNNSDALDDEVKAIRQAYEKGISLMENFENAMKHQADVAQSVGEHSALIENNRNNYEAGETLDRDQVLANNKRYTRLLEESKVLIDNMGKELDSAKELVGDFLAMTRKFQDQSTRVVILQSREKQLNSDLRQLKLSQQEALGHLAARDQQLMALHRKFVEEKASEMDDKLCALAAEIYRIQLELQQLESQDATSQVRSQRQEWVQKRLAIEAQIQELTGQTVAPDS